jgi:membrane protease subunit (stomatin/prohibitin family)
MGLIQAAIGALGGTLADQWKDFYTVPRASPHRCPVRRGAAWPERGRGSNTKGSDGVITNGSRIVVPEGYGLVLMEQGAITGFAAEPGAYEWNSEAQDSQSIFAGNGIVSPLITTSWERFKFGGRPGTQQRAYFVTLKELPNNRFGTQSEIYWDDAYMNAQVGAVTRGTYTLKIVDPILFVRAWVPAKYLEPGEVFDFTDIENDAASAALQRGRRLARSGVLAVHERPVQGEPDHQDPAGLDRLRPEPVGRGRAELPVERPRSADRLHGDHRDRVRREHP